MQGARRQRQRCGEFVGAGEAAGRIAQEAADTFDEQSVASVGEHRQRQGALQHDVEISLVALQRQPQVSRIEGEFGARGAKGQTLAENGGIDPDMRRFGKRE